MWKIERTFDNPIEDVDMMPLAFDTWLVGLRLLVGSSGLLDSCDSLISLLSHEITEDGPKKE